MVCVSVHGFLCGQDLDLCPRSVLVLQPMEENKILAMGQQGAQLFANLSLRLSRPC